MQGVHHGEGPPVGELSEGGMVEVGQGQLQSILVAEGLGQVGPLLAAWARCEPMQEGYPRPLAAGPLHALGTGHELRKLCPSSAQIARRLAPDR